MNSYSKQAYGGKAPQHHVKAFESSLLRTVSGSHANKPFRRRQNNAIQKIMDYDFGFNKRTGTFSMR